MRKWQGIDPHVVALRAVVLALVAAVISVLTALACLRGRGVEAAQDAAEILSGLF